ncbi:MAG: hypothetical protein C0606_00660 [Hyphomicrobiales bacterium]|nr:MAG: hypothetical protein C0606_00660 [Hyphomicrobiales bacterium]
MRGTFWILASALLAALVWAMPPAASANGPAPEVPDEVTALEGTYTGSWTMYGIDADGVVAPNMAWTDTMTASGATVEGDRAFVVTKDEMVFEGGHIPPYTVDGKEGYVLAADGSLAGYFIETYGQTYRMVELAENVWTYTTPAAGEELARLGFPPDASGVHVVVKVVSDEAGVETHRITRVTTVSWKGADGAERVLQFTSLKGVHKRQQ